MAQLIDLTISGDVGVITINNPPVNALSPGVPDGIDAAIQKCCQDPAIKAMILIGGGRTFIAGADIKEFGKITSGQRQTGGTLTSMLPSIEQCPKPVIAAIHGTALGGGLETAMSCHYRVAVASAQVGQPEVKLGIIPGGGGTQRLPRLAGMIKAAQMCAGGEPISAAEAAAAGIVDRIVDGDLLTGALQFAGEIIAAGQPPRKTCDLPVPAYDAQELAQLKVAVAKRSRGLIAPVKAIEAVEAATLPFDQGMQREAEIFFECLYSDQSKSLIHVFFGEREVGKVPGISSDIPLLPIRKAAVIGAGTMGGGIAMNYANAGIPVLLKEASQELLDRGLNIIRKNYAATVAKGRLSQAQMDQRMSLIQPTLTYDSFSEVDIVVEAVFEGMELKKQIFAELDKVSKPDAILASNTSTLDIDSIAAATSRPQQVIGHHFFSPANVMRLLEIVRGKNTSPQVIATSMALAKTLKKVGVLVGNCFGFVGNRMVDPYMREAQFLVEEGASVQEVDAALVDFGMAMGPLAVGDLAGLDVSWRIRQETKHLIVPGTRQPLVCDVLCEQGRYGQKTGKGWYLYPQGSRTPVADPVVAELIEACAAKAGIQRRSVSSEEIVQRTIYALINEGAKILEEGIALRPVDIDIIYIYGYGFPAHRGGPMWYADTVGLAHVYKQICRFEQQHGASWTPAPLLKRLADAGQKFADMPK
ncbi:MAG: enoyl-CoA hydratase/isomerase family protein [Pirellulaceae bacterium]|nr:enoyl-CoA hydratase/isomerase family protein [Pirellulaceae bacterium]